MTQTSNTNTTNTFQFLDKFWFIRCKQIDLNKLYKKNINECKRWCKKKSQLEKKFKMVCKVSDGRLYAFVSVCKWHRVCLTLFLSQIAIGPIPTHINQKGNTFCTVKFASNKDILTWLFWYFIFLKSLFVKSYIKQVLTLHK